MHRAILDPPRGVLVDHVDGNGLNNCRANLRTCTYAENSRNRRPAVGHSSRYLGVTFARSVGRWQAGITVAGKSVYLGQYDTEEEAAQAYNVAAIGHHGSFARLNAIAQGIP